jgi:SPP1 gp7 family putative phage head morphogenesis protein
MAMRPPDGVLLRYRATLRKIVARLVADIDRALVPVLEQVPQPAERVDGSARARRADGVFDSFRAKLEQIKAAVFGQDHSAAVRATAEATGAANAREAQRVLNIDVRAVQPGIAPEIDRFRRENVSLITSIQTDLLGDVDALVADAFTNGARVEELRAEILKRYDVTEARADLIARDQILKLHGRITQARQQSAGVLEYVWTTAGDERVRGNPNGPYAKSDRDHYRLDGKRFRWDAPPVINPKTGETAHPGQDFQCRCVAVPVLSLLEDPDLDESLPDE